MLACYFVVYYSIVTCSCNIYNFFASNMDAEIKLLISIGTQKTRGPLLVYLMTVRAQVAVGLCK